MFRIFKKLLIIFVNVVILSKLAYSSDTIFNEINLNIPDTKIYNANSQELLFSNLFERNTNYLVNFWATWCQPCKKELPELEKIYRDLKDYNIKIYIISIDKKNIKDQNLFLKKLKLRYLKSFFDPNMKLFNSFNLRGIPTTIVVKNNKVIAIKEGIIEYSENLKKELIGFFN